MRRVQAGRSAVPKGVAVYLPEATAQRRQVEDTILSVFRRWGYQEVITPLFDYLDVIAVGLDEALIEKGYKFVDRSTGRLMILRPDVTPQIARMVAHLLQDQPMPLRLCYSANVFRHEEEHAGREREIFQIGGELIGDEGVNADAEVIALAATVLKSVGLKEFRITIGETRFFTALCDGIGLSSEKRKQVQRAVARKETSTLERLLSGQRGAQRLINVLLEISTLFGSRSVLDHAVKITPDPAARAAVRKLSSIYEALISHECVDSLLFDLGEVRGFGYYTGMVFDIAAEGVGYELGGGGRYDTLLEKFGYPAPAVGFAFRLEHLMASLIKDGGVSKFSSADLLIIDRHRERKRGIMLATILREKGYRVILRVVRSCDVEEVSAAAKREGIRKVIVIGGDDLGRDQILLCDPLRGQRKKGGEKEILSFLSG